MITWTTAGAVPTPDALQVRVGATFHDRVAVGAPTPRRAMDVSEVVANVRHFTVDRDGPRARAVTTLVLSGVHEGFDALAGVVAAARPSAAGHVGHVVVHVEAAHAEAVLASALGREADDVVCVVGASGPACPRGITASVRLDEATLAALPSVVERTSAARRVVFTWPFPVPGAAPPPAAGEVVRALTPWVEQVPRPTLKGLPPCAWGQPVAPSMRPLFERVARTRNRFYVDAEHQLDRALTFFPDLVRWTKSDVCRRCRVDTRCDGVVGAWYDRGLAGRLEPLTDEPSSP